jgi:hypothetical protein
VPLRVLTNYRAVGNVKWFNDAKRLSPTNSRQNFD